MERQQWRDAKAGADTYFAFDGGWALTTSVCGVGRVCAWRPIALQEIMVYGAHAALAMRDHWDEADRPICRTSQNLYLLAQCNLCGCGLGIFSPIFDGSLILMA